MAERAIAKQGLDEIGIDEELPSVFSSSEDVGEAVPPAAPPIPPVAREPLGNAVDEPHMVDFMDSEGITSNRADETPPELRGPAALLHQRV